MKKVLDLIMQNHNHSIFSTSNITTRVNRFITGTFINDADVLYNQIIVFINLYFQYRFPSTEKHFPVSVEIFTGHFSLIQNQV